jgi:DNA-binding transcriptional LysR family regulator
VVSSGAATSPLALPNLTVQQLEYLVAVSRFRTGAEAAAALGVSPSALSQGLAELERRVGVRIFERDGRRRIISTDAQEVLAHAEAVLSRTRDLARWAAGVRTGALGQVRVGMIDAALHHFADALRRFRRDHPQVDLRLTVAPSGPLLTDLARATLDLVVCVALPRPVEGVATANLLTESLRAYAPAGADRAAPPSAWGPWVTFPEGSHTRHIIGVGLASLNAPFDVVAQSHHPDVLRERVGLGLGWTVLPVNQAEAGADPLTPVRTRPVAERHLVLARRQEAHHGPATEALAAIFSS